ncbi:MAG: N-6 DNA methylase, partial [Flavobacteriales bacterium]|nr:N-6 DNA methylase [Flavobacteriales bacterium]
MPLFQSAVLNKYLKQQDDAAIRAAYARFRQHFHAPEIQANIRNSKEEQYQEGFLRDLFVDILGYTLNPQPGFQLTTEFKNEKGNKKADGAILQQGKALAVIELKGTDTTDLASINPQAFHYKANHTDCVYVVTSNFERLRFFIDNAVEHLEFDLFTLTEEQFRLLWLCLQRDNLLGGIPKKVKAESLQEEEQVTKRLYKDYSAFKTALWQDLCTQHPEHDKLLLYKKTQKLLDRFLFVLFGEDKGLLPPNTLRGIVDQWQKLRELDEYRPLYERCQKYFGYLNTGHKSPAQEIFAYNGGLFKPDELLDGVRISDAVLEEHLTKLTKYDFASEVDVNILGHIFEHSLNEIEAITAELEGRALDTKKTKRKKDGVFYTPKYITKYIVENTVGRLCTEKKDELAIVDEEYARGRKGRQKKTIQELLTKLDVYRDWLLSLTICDPACGSGAFLNQALEYLINEHAYVNELESQVRGESIVFKDIGDHILERNIYGVDINEESVEIARLSLRLRTATKGRKLNDLSGNIKCGNSLD